LSDRSVNLSPPLLVSLSPCLPLSPSPPLLVPLSPAAFTLKFPINMLWLVLTNPYAYDRALERAVRTAKKGDVPLNVTFVIDPQALDELMVDLGEKGWLGMASRRTLRDSMIEGYRALAEDTLELVKERGDRAEIPLVAALEEVPLETYLDRILNAGADPVIVSASRAVRHANKDFAGRVQWVEED